MTGEIAEVASHRKDETKETTLGDLRWLMRADISLNAEMVAVSNRDRDAPPS